MENQREQLNSSYNPTFEFNKAGDTFTGVLVETREVSYKKGKKEINTKIHTFKATADDVLTDVWGSAIIDRSIEKCEAGDTLEIVYKGQGETKDGAKLNLFDVFRIAHAA